MKKLKKIVNNNFNLKVVSQGCGDDCTEKVWAGKTSSEGNAGGCWTTDAQTPRTTTLF